MPIKKSDEDMRDVHIFAGAVKDLAQIEEFLCDKIDYLSVAMVGSVYTNPAEMNNDVDVLLLVEDTQEASQELVTQYNAAVGGSTLAGDPDCWQSLRFGGTNVLLCDDPMFFMQFRIAAEVCRLIKPTKPQRVAIHEIIMDGKKADDFKDAFL